jgi:hypothetical protein
MELLLRILNRAWVAIKAYSTLTVFSLIITLVLGVYPILQGFYSNYKDLTVHYSAVRSQLFSRDNLDNIQISSNGRVVIGDVNIGYITVWNNGDQPLIKSDIKKSVSITLPNVVILSVKSKATNRIEAKIKCKKLASLPNQLVLEWDFIEGGDAAVIQVIYEGGIADEIKVDGVVLGQVNKKISYFDEKQVPNRKNNGQIVRIVINLVMFVSLVLMNLDNRRAYLNLQELNRSISSAVDKRSSPTEFNDDMQNQRSFVADPNFWAMYKMIFVQLVILVLFIITGLIYPVYQYVSSVKPPITIASLTTESR